MTNGVIWSESNFATLEELQNDDASVFVRTAAGLFKQVKRSVLASAVRSGKPDAGADKTVACEAGVKSVKQAFDELDAFDYSRGWRRTITIPADYPFTPSDALFLMGRTDVGNLTISSDQYPAMHSYTGDLGNNVLGFESALFAFLNSGLFQFKVSIDMSGATGRTKAVVSWNSDLILMGDPFSDDKAEFKAPPVASEPAVSMFNNRSEFVLLKADDVYVEGHTSQYYKLQLDATPVGHAPLIINNKAQTLFQVDIGDDVEAQLYGNSEIYLRLRPGNSPLKLVLGGRFTTSDTGLGTRTFWPKSGDTVFTFTGDEVAVNFTAFCDLAFQPQLATHGIANASNCDGGRLAIARLDEVNIDTSVTGGAIGLILPLSAAYNVDAYITGSQLWPGTKYDVAANSAGMVTNSTVHDPWEPMELVDVIEGNTSIGRGDHRRYKDVVAAAVITVPLAGPNFIAVGMEIPFNRNTAEAVSFAKGDPSITFNKVTTSIANQGDVVVLKHVALDVWHLVGPTV